MARGHPTVRLRQPAAERGMVTAEIATALPVLVALIIVAVWSVAAAASQARCADAAREAARAAARGEDDAVIRKIAEEVAPRHATITVDRANGRVVVEVQAGVPVPPPFSGSLDGPRVRGRAVAVEEPR